MICISTSTSNGIVSFMRLIYASYLIQFPGKGKERGGFLKNENIEFNYAILTLYFQTKYLLRYIYLTFLRDTYTLYINIH